MIDNGDGDKDVTATEVRITAGTAIGAGNALDLAVTTVAAQAGAGGIFLVDDNDLTIGTVAGVQVQRVAGDGVAALNPAPAAVALSGLTSSAGGHIVMFTLNGTLTVAQAVSAGGAGNVFLNRAHPH